MDCDSATSRHENLCDTARRSRNQNPSPQRTQRGRRGTQENQKAKVAFPVQKSSQTAKIPVISNTGQPEPQPKCFSPIASRVVTKTFETQRKGGNGGFLGCEDAFTVPFALTSNGWLRGLAAGPDRRHILDEKERGSH